MTLSRISVTLIAGLVLAVGSAPASAQSSSIARQRLDSTPAELPAREAAIPTGNPALEARSMIAVKSPGPKKFRINDLVTIIVRQQTIYEADAEANNRRQADLRSELQAFIKFTDGGIGASAFRRGNPNINYRQVFNQRNQGETEREDRLTTRITARIVDIKPNGNMVLEAKSSLKHDDQVHSMMLTGGCRSIDVTPDNTVLSTQVADLAIEIQTKGGVRNATRQGWIGEIYDLIRPL